MSRLVAVLAAFAVVVAPGLSHADHHPGVDGAGVGLASAADDPNCAVFLTTLSGDHLSPTLGWSFTIEAHKVAGACGDDAPVYVCLGSWGPVTGGTDLGCGADRSFDLGPAPEALNGDVAFEMRDGPGGITITGTTSIVHRPAL